MTFADLLTSQLRADPGRPLVTFYDDATGERVELSVATYANWVAKTASLFAEEFDLERGDTIRIDLPTHWLGPVFLGAAWTLGLVVTDDPDADLRVVGPEGVNDPGNEPDRTLACALRPLGVRFAEPLPDGVRDFGVEVWSQPDAFVAIDPPGTDDPALRTGDRTATHATLLAELESLPSGTRLMTTANPVQDPTSFLAPLAAGGSTVWVAHAEAAAPGVQEERATAERVTRRG